MITAKLLQSLWATKKIDGLGGMKFMLAEEVGGSDERRRIVVVDTIGGGIGDLVIVCTGSAARKALGNDQLPVDAAVVGIIDEDCEIK